MNYLTSLRALTIAGVVFAAPATGFSKDKHSHGSSHAHVYSQPYCAPHYSSRPSISLGFYTTPSYYRSSDYYYDSYPTRTYTTRTVYRTVPRTSYSSGYSDDLAVDVQRALARRGYYRGGIDGDVGPGTRAAIRSYQYERGLTVTGRIDSSLLRSLGVS